MNTWIAVIAFLIGATAVGYGCGNHKQKTLAPITVIGHLQDTAEPIVTITKSQEEWRSILSDEEYHVLREQGTERPFQGEYWDYKKDGIYSCRGCDLDLFDSETKFKSGTGWPSFWQPFKNNHISENVDISHGMRRVEVVCARCGGHLGHVFPDGPEPTGLRYCINSVSLQFHPRNE